MALRNLSEIAFRQMSVSLAKTRVTRKSEADIFTSGVAEGPKIQVDLHPSSPGATGEVHFHELKVVTHDGDPLELNGENGKPIDAEMCEFIVGELINGDDAIPGIMEGRATPKYPIAPLAKTGFIYQLECEVDAAMAGPQ